VTPAFLARLFARFRRVPDTRVYKLDDPEQDGPAWSSAPIGPGPGWWLSLRISDAERLRIAPWSTVRICDGFGGEFYATVTRTGEGGITVVQSGYQLGKLQFAPRDRRVSVILLPWRPDGRIEARIGSYEISIGLEVIYA